MTNSSRRAVLALGIAGLAAAPIQAIAFSSYYDSNCSACHGTTAAGGVQTCAGCHSHGTHPDSAKNSLDLTGATSKASYAPGETVSVVINGGYRGGWVRALLYDQNLHELARSTGAVKPGFSAPCCGSGFPITLSAPAPTTPGTYTWWVAWYGNQFDASGAFFGPNFVAAPNPGHGEERVQTNSFTVVAASNPVVALSPPALSFGSVNVGSASSLTTSIQNTGTAALTVSAIALCAGTVPEFSWAPAAPITVPAGGSSVLTVTFTAANADSDVGCLTLTTNDPANPSVNLSVSATGVASATPSIALSPASLSFGTVTVGSSAVLPTQVQDTGTAPLNVTSIAPCAGTTGVFTWSPAAPFTVAAGGNTTLSVTYTPTGAAGDSGCLAIASNDAAQPTVNLTLTGNGAATSAAAIAFSPATLGFGTVTVGNTAQLTAQVQNGGTAPLTVTAIAACSGTSTEFTWSPAAPFTVAPGQSTALTVTYAPTDVDAELGCLAVSSNDPGKPVANLALTAQGAAAPTPAIALAPTSLDFATVQVGASSPLTTQIQSVGGAALNVTSIAACSGTSPEFTWAPNAPFGVSPGQSTVLTVTYAPTDAGPDNGCIAITSDDPVHGTVTLGVTGSGSTVAAFPAVALVPDSLDFGTVTVGGTAMRTSQVQNTGTAPLDVLGIAACSGTSPEFTWSPTTPFTVAPGRSATVTVTYAPTDTGTDTGCLAVASNDPSNPSANLQLTGTGSQQPVANVDIDIDELKVPEEVQPSRTSSITPRLHAKNSGKVDGSATARLVGVLAGVQVYDQSITVTLPKGEDGTFPFPAYAVASTASGRLLWTVTIDDTDPDVDRATARTQIGRGGDDGHDGEGDGSDDGGTASSGSSGTTGPTGPTGPTTGGTPGKSSDSTTTNGGSLKASMSGCSTGGTAMPGVLLALAALLAGRRPYRRNR
jgi:hypothetical protein